MLMVALMFPNLVDLVFNNNAISEAACIAAVVIQRRTAELTRSSQLLLARPSLGTRASRTTTGGIGTNDHAKALASLCKPTIENAITDTTPGPLIFIEAKGFFRRQGTDTAHISVRPVVVGRTSRRICMSKSL